MGKQLKQVWGNLPHQYTKTSQGSFKMSAPETYAQRLSESPLLFLVMIHSRRDGSQVSLGYAAPRSYWFVKTKGFYPCLYVIALAVGSLRSSPHR